MQGTNNPEMKKKILKNKAKEPLSLKNSLINLGMTKKFPLSCRLTEHTT